MRLHVAALAFPTVQGTQAVIRAMLESESGAGLHSALLTYPTGSDDGLSFNVFRPRTSPLSARSSLRRSGPSATKVALDLQLVGYLRGLVGRLRPQAVIAHHVEAAVAALLSGARQVTFFAHTDLEQELPSYTRPALASLVAASGRTLDRLLVDRCQRTVAISPLLAARLGRPGREVTYVPPPILDVPRQIDRNFARAVLGLPTQGSVILYAGNLDAYQGVDRLPKALALLGQAHGLRPLLLVATQSNPRLLLTCAKQYGVQGQVHVTGLDGTDQRGLVHSAADLAIVPRRALGGLPVKLLDAMAHGLPVVTCPAAAAGLPIAEACFVADSDAPPGLSNGLHTMLSDTMRAQQLGRAGRAYVRRCHSPAQYLNAMDAAHAAR